MSVHDDIQQMAQRLAAGESTRRRGLIELYSAGVSAKLRNAEFAFKNLTDLDNAPEDPDFMKDERLHFFVDSFFAFLYSSYDVIAQVINQKLRLGLDERRVSIKTVCDALNAVHTGTPLQRAVDALLRSHHFTNLDRYRNCSTHRRQIYVQRETRTVSGTPGYNLTGIITTTTTLLCDDPLTLRPTVSQRRELSSYCTKMLTRGQKEISTIARTI